MILYIHPLHLSLLILYSLLPIQLVSFTFSPLYLSPPFHGPPSLSSLLRVLGQRREWRATIVANRCSQGTQLRGASPYLSFSSPTLFLVVFCFWFERDQGLAEKSRKWLGGPATPVCG